MQTNVNIWSAMIWMMSLACFIFSYLYVKSMVWDHGQIWWELCYRLWGNWSRREMLWAAAHGHRVKMSDFVMLIRTKIGKRSGELWRQEWWRRTLVHNRYGSDKWLWTMEDGDDHPWWCWDEVIRVVQWAVLTEWRNNGASWQWRWRRNIER